MTGRDLFGMHKDGSEIPVEIGLNPIEAEEGVFVLASVIDIGPRKQVEAELRRSNEELERFAYVASHDLQEPLRTVSSYVQLLSRRYRDRLDADAVDFIDFAVGGARRMQRLIEDLLVFSRVGTRGAPLVPTDMQTAFESTLASLHAAIEESRATVTADPLPAVLADGSQLAQLLANLIGNALKFRGEGPPRVHVSALRTGRFWTIGVQDNGIGIAPEYFERIFVIFQRLHSREEYAGTGVGLAICKKIVERHGGRIWVESSSGDGARFSFTLQAATE
jgi:light-regulated signal transduction histidine kinase (bacteriophytochrome)